MLFSADGALRVFHYYLRQMPCELAGLLPEPPMNHIREHYPKHFLCAVLPAGEGYRAELFGADDRTLHFDSEGRFVRAE